MGKGKHGGLASAVGLRSIPQENQQQVHVPCALGISFGDIHVWSRAGENAASARWAVVRWARCPLASEQQGSSAYFFIQKKGCR